MEQAALGAFDLPTLDDVRGRRELEGRAGGRPPLDDSAAVEHACLGDERAFALLVERYGQPILSLCFASTLNPADAEELTQEIFLAAWRGLGRFRGDSTFSTWLFALARNACVDHARRAAVRPRLADSAEASPAGREALDDAVRLTAAAILDTAASLSLPLRQALLLRDVQGLSYEEIAQLQGVPLGTVRSRIAAARTAVAKEVEG